MHVTLISRLFMPIRNIDKQLSSFWSANAVSRSLYFPSAELSGTKFLGWIRPNQKEFLTERQRSFW
jgi:hypothetical protein